MASTILRLIGWRVDGLPPDVPKYVATFAPHTSNWDLPMVVMFGLVLRVTLLWLGKASLFRGPAGPIMRWLGGLPVDRSKSNSVVSSAIRYFDQRDHITIGVAPEGTRSRVGEWKRGFYHIACGARVPIATTYLDYRRKTGGYGPTFTPTGDADADVARIREFYAGITGKRRPAEEGSIEE